MPLLEKFSGAAREQDLERRRWVKMFTGLALISIGLAVALACAYALLGARGDAWVAVIVALGAAGSLTFFRVTQDIRLTQRFLLSLFLIIFAGSALALGEVTYLAWVAVLILMAFFVGGPVLGLGWAMVMMGVLIAAGTAMWLFPLAPEPVSGAVRLLRVCSLAPVLGAYGYFYELARTWNASELEAARAAAQQANEAKSRLLSKVSHEIRTPLNGVLGVTRALLARPLPSTVVEDLELVEKSGAGLLALINDLLDIGRAEAGKVELHLTALELGSLLNDLCSLYRSTAAEKGLELKVESDLNEPAWVLVDDVRIRQVLGNLISNALKFTSAGSVVIRLRLGAEVKGRVETTISVEDSGIGLDPISLAEVFEPFKQFHPHLAQGGSGLGLAISQELAKCMGGWLDARSVQGEGSTFSLHLPLERTEAPRTLESPPERLERFSALVVDDNAINRRVATAFVSLLGGEPTQACDGYEALRLAAERTFDVILMDLQMPGIDGLQTLATLRGKGVTTPVLAITAAAAPEVMTRCLEAGMNGCLVKPVQLGLLRGELRRVLKSSSRAA